MPAPPSQPRRTVAIILLDGIVAAARTARRALAGRGGGSRLAQVAILASLGVLLATAYSVVTVLRTPERLTPVAVEPPPDLAVADAPATGTPGEQPEPTSATPRASAHATTTAPPAAPPVGRPSGSAPSATSAAPPTPVALRADFAVENTALLSYGAAVTITNPGVAGATDWQLVIVLPRESLEVSSVTGARASRDGATWTFVPEGSAGAVPGRGAARVTFRVNGAAISATPRSCTIDGVACTGLPN
ncbi:cellulose binding domain-containing protein [Micromonospora sp. DR5-3]|uniref:cellulose binding domain-containing protein n=1 Tax=unclassified Micromonospora TaxID=2617518 RepID=UPI001652587E|nr:MULTISPECIES: cellulose binding domain-containing protein [unclassified Micromonospora]MCW3816260.1 cellulose binding domain-containing protein [Micromonospora sp. DR5-3]